MGSELSIQQVLGRDGVLARRLQAFRERPQQILMAQGIESAVSRGRHLLVEAPTGVGKSLAYLVPLLLGPVAAGKKVVVATHTIALQDQLLDKDLPLLASCLPIEFTVTKALGRTNYVGLRRMSLALDAAPGLVTGDPEVVALRRIAAWTRSTLEGRRQELDPPPRQDVWEQVQSESDNCLGQRCPTFQECHYQGARRRLQTADVIVTNHALYCLDLVLRQVDSAILPEHDVLVIDEAHHLERVASDHFGIEVSRRGVRHLIRRLTGARGSPGILQRVGGHGIDVVRDLVRGIAERSEVFFDDVDAWCAERPTHNGRYREAGIVEDILSEPLRELADRLDALAHVQGREELQVEIQAFAHRTLAHASSIESLLSVADPDMVYFVERSEERRNTTLAARPLDVATTLRTELFQRVPSVILASATLAAGRDPQDLAYTASRLGCDAADQLVLDSPFDYPRLVEVHVPSDLPFPDASGFDAGASAAALRYIDRSGGGAFLLFTSYRTLEGFWRHLCGPLRARGLLALRQGDGTDRSTLLARFRDDGNAVLFGAESFWHGVDVPGPALRLVIITRLPFPVPTTPINEARGERLRASGQHPFSVFSLPEALIRFRQGCGRLVRAEDDEGLIVCLDRRILDKPYGQRFRASLGEGITWVTGKVPAESPDFP